MSNPQVELHIQDHGVIALELDADDANAHAAKAHYLTLTAWDWRTAAVHYARSRELGMSSGAVLLFGGHFLAALVFQVLDLALGVDHVRMLVGVALLQLVQRALELADAAVKSMHSKSEIAVLI